MTTRNCWSARCVVAFSALVATGVASAQVVVGAGSQLDLGDADIALGCVDLTIAGSVTGTAADISGIDSLGLDGGTLAPGGSRLLLGDDFDNGGTFVPGASWIGIVDACGDGTSLVQGSTVFNALEANSATGKQLVFEANVTQTVLSELVLSGAAGNLLRIRSSAPGQRARLDVGDAAAQTVAFVDAADNAATGARIAPGPAATYQSLDAGNLINWFENPATGDPPPGGDPVARPVPASGWPAIGLLALALLALSGRRLRRTLQPTHII
jgi:hypothetical protein